MFGQSCKAFSIQFWVDKRYFSMQWRFHKNYNKENDKGYFLEVDVQCLEKLQELYNDLLVLPETMKVEKVKKLVANLHDKTEYAIQLGNLKQVCIHGLVLKKLLKVIKFI